MIRLRKMILQDKVVVISSVRVFIEYSMHALNFVSDESLHFAV